MWSLDEQTRPEDPDICLDGTGRTPEHGATPVLLGCPNVSEDAFGQYDRALIRELGAYLKQNPKADDRDQGFAALFNKAIEHDWFADNEEAALRT